MKIGLFFGSFNPVHIGHMALANYFVEFTDIDELWFILSPHNPLKEKSGIIDCQVRLGLLKIAIDNDKRFKVSDIEFNLPQPSYTIETLQLLKEKYPKNEFIIIMGSDGLPTFNQWKDYQAIIEQYTRYIYPRYPDSSTDIEGHKNIKVVDAPRIDISSTFIRNKIALGHDIRHFLPKGVYLEILQKGYYI